MTELKADTASIAAFGVTAAAMAGELHVAGLSAAAAGPLLLGPVFGIIGGDFVAAFAAAHSAHTASIAQLSGVFDSIAGAAASSAAGYIGTEAANAASLAAINPEASA